jgi:hypothetical protein
MRSKRLAGGSFKEIACEPSENELKQLLDQRAAQQLRLDGLADDYACGLLDQADIVTAPAA